MKTILIVDDEVPILKALARVFFDTDYQILTAENGEDALKLLSVHKVDLVLSDMRMPLMDGYELLSIVKELYPATIRVILSGYSEEKTIFKGLVHNIAQIYIFKPWNNDELLQAVHQLLETEDLLTSADLLLLFNNLEELPTISKSYETILGMVEQNADIIEIAEEIEKDPAIATRLLHVANSAFYGLQTGSVKQAAIYVGLQNLRSLIYSTSILDVNLVSEKDQVWITRLWKHSLITSRMLHYIYDNLLFKKVPEAAYSAGLLHNIGVLILIQNFFERYTSIVREAWDNQDFILPKEAAEFKITHQEAGAYLVGWWGLPFPIIEVALYHHRPLDPGVINKELLACVHIAQHYAWVLLGEPVIAEFHPEVFDSLGITREEFEDRIKMISW